MDEQKKLKNNIVLKITSIIVTFLLLMSLATASDTEPVYESDVQGGGGYLVPNWNKLPFKHQKANLSWVQFVNNQYNPNPSWSVNGYDYNNEKTSPICLSYAAATANDWFSLQTGRTLGNYQNFINNRTENGTNPRELEAIYHDRKGDNNYDQSLYDYAPLLDSLKVTMENVPYDIKGYIDILIDPPMDWNNQNDPVLGVNYKHTVLPDEYIAGGAIERIKENKWVPIPTSKERIKEALETYGPLYTHLSTAYILPLHAAVIIGYGTYNGTEGFWIHDSYKDEYNGSNVDTKYKFAKVSALREIIAFYDPQWPTENHDFRRTGFTLLKGDMKRAQDVEKLSFVLESTGITGQDQVVKSIVADIDGNGAMETVSLVNRNTLSNQTRIYAVDIGEKRNNIIQKVQEYEI